MQIELRRTTASSVPATTHQQLFWYTELADRDSNLYLSRAFLIEGSLDRGALERSLTALVDGQTIFRSTYREVDGVLHQVILSADEAPRVELEYADLSLAPSEWDAALARMASELVGRLDLARGRVVGARLARLAPDRHALVLVIHHIATDARSTSEFTRRLFAGYVGECSGTTARVDPPFQFIDLVDALVRWRETSAGLAASAYWHERLRGVVPVEVPGDLPRAPVDSRRDAAPHGITAEPMHAAEHAVIPDDTRVAVRDLARREASTSSTVYLAALIQLLHRETGQTELCIEAVADMRSAHPGLDDLLGMHSTWMIYRVNVAGCATLRDVVRRTEDAVAEAREHFLIDDYYRLVPHTVRRVVFNYVPMRAETEQIVGDLRIVTKRLPLPRWTRPWDLHLSLIDATGPAAVVWTGSEQIFRRATLSALLQRYLGVLADL